MIHSMTAYASQESNTINGVLQLEIRSVNHRYLELQLKLDDHCRQFEALVREQLNARLGRGKIDCRLSLAKDIRSSAEINVDENVVKQVATSANEVSQHFSHSQPVNLLDILKIPGVIVSNALDVETLQQDIKGLVSLSIDDLVEARAREGIKLKAMILERLASVESQVSKVKPLLPKLVKAYQEKLSTKLNEACKSADEARIQQEIVLYTQRVDVDEELSRLISHIEEVKRILETGGIVGKRLDFLMQEMNREANTLGSKSVSIETTQVSMELKVLIEQMREQIQNIE